MSVKESADGDDGSLLVFRSILTNLRVHVACASSISDFEQC